MFSEISEECRTTISNNSDLISSLRVPSPRRTSSHLICAHVAQLCTKANNKQTNVTFEAARELNAMLN